MPPQPQQQQASGEKRAPLLISDADDDDVFWAEEKPWNNSQPPSRWTKVTWASLAVSALLLVGILVIFAQPLYHFGNRHKYQLGLGPKPWFTVQRESLPRSPLSHGAVGDVIFESTLQRQAARYGTYAESWSAVVDYLQATDITYANHEGVASYAMAVPVYSYDDNGTADYSMQDIDYGEQDLVYGESEPAVFYSGGKFLQFNYHPMLADDLAASGIDVVSTANNHCLDRGSIGINSTIQSLQNAGVAHAGTRQSTDDPWHGMVNVTTRQGSEWKIAYVACTDSTNENHNHRDRQKDIVLNCYSKRYLDLIRELAAHPEVHAVVAVIHWGGPNVKDDEGDDARAQGYRQKFLGWGARGIVYQREPDCAMRSLAHQVAEAGAVALLGAHPHVLHGWERLTTSYGRSVLIVYSLGNFVGHGGYAATKPPPNFLGRGYDSDVGFLFRRTSVLLQFGLEWNDGQNWAQVSCMSYVPIYRSLTDVGYVEEALTEQGKITYEIHVETAPADSEERDFIASRFGPLRRYSQGGGVSNGQEWEAPLLDTDTGTYEMSVCYPFDQAPETKVDHKLHEGVVHTNDVDDHTFRVSAGLCNKCEQAYDDPQGCRWCLYRSNSYCQGNNETVKMELGTGLAWDDCLELVAAAASDCSNVAHAGGGKGVCTCVRAGQRCQLAKSQTSLSVYERDCGAWPRKTSL